MGHQGEPVAVPLAPRTRVAIAHFHEINGAVKFGAPIAGGFALEVGIDLYEGAGPEKRRHGKIIEADVAILAMADVEALDERDGHFSPDFDHAREQIGFLDAETAIEAHGESDHFIGIGSFHRDEMGILKRHIDLVAQGIFEVDIEEAEKVGKFGAVDDAEAEKFVDAGDRVFIFELSEPGVGNIELVIAAIRGDTAT